MNHQHRYLKQIISETLISKIRPRVSYLEVVAVVVEYRFETAPLVAESHLEGVADVVESHLEIVT